MTLWHTVLVASVICAALKLAGWTIPTALFERPRPKRILELLTVALLGALIAVQALASGQEIVLDARIPAVGLAAVLFSLRVPFIVVVVAAAVVAALLRRLLGWP